MTTPTPPPPPEPDRGKDAGVYSMIAIASIIVASLLGWAWAGSSRADLAQWFAAVSSAATLVAAIIAASFAAGAFRLETKREERYREDQRRHQAERFAAWYDVVDQTATMPGTRMRLNYRSQVVWARNASDLPVTSVTFVLLHNGEPITDQYKAVVPPSAEPIKIYLEDQATTAIERFVEFLHDEQQEMVEHTFDVDLAFTDAAGRRWFRRHDGDLQQVPEES